jgi:hypothetical protein
MFTEVLQISYTGSQIKWFNFYIILNVTYFFVLQKYNMTAEIETLYKKSWFEILGLVENSNWKHD